VPNPELLRELRKRRVSLFNIHYPLDNYSDYSNSKRLAEALGIIVEIPFAEFSGALCGVIGTIVFHLENRPLPPPAGGGGR